MTSSVDLRGLAIDRGESATPGIKRRRHVLTRYVLPLMLVCGFLAVIAWSAWDIVFPPHAVTVVPVISTTSTVQQAGTPLFNAAGWVEPRPTPVRIAALAPGVVEELLVVEDQRVDKGEPVAELVKDDAELVYQRALADLALRKAELSEAEASVAAAKVRFEQPVHLEAALGEAEAALAKIQTLLKNLPFQSRRAAADYEAARKDYEGKSAANQAVAGIQIDIAESKMNSARALVDELQDRAQSLEQERAALIQRRNALQTQLELLTDETKARDESSARLAAAKARVAQAEVAVAEARLQLDRMTIRAPIAGRIYRLVSSPGTRLGGSTSRMEDSDSSTVVTMYDPKRLQIRVDVRFEDVPRVQLDQPVDIDNPALADPIRGRVLFISSEADIQKNTLQVKVEIPDPPAVFRPEMLVDVTFLAPPDPQRSDEPASQLKIYVLQQLVHQEESGSFVWLADHSAGIARKVFIETGAVGNGGLVEVTRGLKVGSRIISSGSESLEEGQPIRITGEDQSLGLSAPSVSGNRAKSLNRLPPATGE